MDPSLRLHNRSGTLDQLDRMVPHSFRLHPRVRNENRPADRQSRPEPKSTRVRLVEDARTLPPTLPDTPARRSHSDIRRTGSANPIQQPERGFFRKRLPRALFMVVLDDRKAADRRGQMGIYRNGLSLDGAHNIRGTCRDPRGVHVACREYALRLSYNSPISPAPFPRSQEDKQGNKLESPRAAFTPLQEQVIPDNNTRRFARVLTRRSGSFGLHHPFMAARASASRFIIPLERAQSAIPN